MFPGQTKIRGLERHPDIYPFFVIVMKNVHIFHFFLIRHWINEKVLKVALSTITITFIALPFLVAPLACSSFVLTIHNRYFYFMLTIQYFMVYRATRTPFKSGVNSVVDGIRIIITANYVVQLILGLWCMLIKIVTMLDLWCMLIKTVAMLELWCMLTKTVAI
jgi:hypothetical protein